MKNTALNLHALFDLLYKKEETGEGRPPLFPKDSSGAGIDARDPEERKRLLNTHFGPLRLDFDSCNDGQIRAIVGMKSGKSRGGAAAIRKQAVARLSDREVDLYRALIIENNGLLEKYLTKPEQLKDFLTIISEYAKTAGQNLGNIDVFGSDCLEKIISYVNSVLMAEQPSYISFSKALTALMVAALLQDRARDVTFLFGEKKALTPGFTEKLKTLEKNVRLMDKEEAENGKEFPFFERMFSCKKLSLLVYAGTSFISGADVSYQYKMTNVDPYQEYFRESLLNESISADICLVNPFSPGGSDAITKMRPLGGGMPSEKIILHNIKELLAFKKRTGAKIKLYLTNTCLPYGILLVDGDDPSSSYAKIDLYGAELPSDLKRKSFYLSCEDPATQSLYKDYRDNFEAVRKQSIAIDNVFNFSWLSDRSRPLIHRGRLNARFKEHCILGFQSCIQNNLGMEVDLLFLTDKSIILGRETEIKNKSTGITFLLSSCTLSQLRSMDSKNYCLPDGQDLPFSFEQTMLLEELLDMVNGRVPLLLELKAPYDEDKSSLSKKAEALWSVLQHYNNGENIAIHSANPRFLAESKNKLAIIAHGQITWNFANLDGEVPEEYLQIHRNLEFTAADNDEFIDPDFVSCGINDKAFLEQATAFARARSIPIIAWTIKNESQEFSPEIRMVDNIIIEGGKTFENSSMVKNTLIPGKPSLREETLGLGAEILALDCSSAPEIQRSVRTWMSSVGTEKEEDTIIGSLVPSLVEGLHSLKTLRKHPTDDTSHPGSLSAEPSLVLEKNERLYNFSKKLLGLLFESVF